MLGLVGCGCRCCGSIGVGGSLATLALASVASSASVWIGVVVVGSIATCCVSASCIAASTRGAANSLARRQHCHGVFRVVFGHDVVSPWLFVE